tara:strand:+ start:570 stop:1313 length:744 start_codon:yes stop_codon:yes gene_type:complete
MNQLPGKVSKKILIIGSSSFLAGKLIKNLSEKNLVICVDKIMQIKKKNKNVKYYKCDITNPRKLEAIKKDIKNKFHVLDIIINCFVHQNYLPFEKQKHKDFSKSINTNVTGVFLITKIFYKLLKKSNNPQIINLGSIYGIVSGDPSIYPNKNVTSDVYAASKAAIIQLTKYYAVHLSKYKIRVNCLSPGGIFNNQHKDLVKNYNKKVPMKRMAAVEEIVSCIEFLLDDRCKYLNGHNLIVDGGFTAW